MDFRGDAANIELCASIASALRWLDCPALGSLLSVVLRANNIHSWILKIQAIANKVHVLSIGLFIVYWNCSYFSKCRHIFWEPKALLQTSRDTFLEWLAGHLAAIVIHGYCFRDATRQYSTCIVQEARVLLTRLLARGLKHGVNELILPEGSRRYHCWRLIPL